MSNNIGDDGIGWSEIPTGGGGGTTPVGSNYAIQYNAVGSFGGTGPGTAGQVLTSNGASSAPSFQSSGGIVTVTVFTASGNVSLTTATYLLIVNKTTPNAGPTIVDLPASPATGQVFIVKDGRGDSYTNNITVTPASGTIDNADTFVISVAYESDTFVYDGNQWRVV